MDTSRLAIDYFYKLVDAYNLIPARLAKVSLNPTDTWYPIRDTLAVIAERAIQLEQQAGPDPLPQKEILLLELTALAGNQDKRQAVYDVTKKIHKLALEAINAILEKEIPRAEREQNYSDLEKLNLVKQRIPFYESWWKDVTPENAKDCAIITPPEIGLPAWYTEVYTNQQHEGVLMPYFFNPDEDDIPSSLDITPAKKTKKNECCLIL